MGGMKNPFSRHADPILTPSGYLVRPFDFGADIIGELLPLSLGINYLTQLATSS
jgi:hypothetical protein